jgi:hypothetical protein
VTGVRPAQHPVATVDGVAITVGAVEARVGAIRGQAGPNDLPAPGSPEDRRLRRWVVHALVNEAVLVTEARRAGFCDVANVAGVAGVADVADTVVRLFDGVTAEVTVDGQEVAAYYARNLDRYRCPERRRVHHVLLGDEAAAGDVRRRLCRGQPLARAAATRSLDPSSRDRGGDLGWLRRGELAGPLEDAVFDVAPGGVVGPVRTDFGWHVAEVLAVQPATTVPLDAVREAIHADLLAAARGRRFDAWLDQRRARLAVVSPGYEHPGDPRVPDGSHRH